MKPLRYAIYCRKSTDTEDKQVLSLESQEKELLSIASREGLEVTTVLTERMSAKEPGRPVYTELISLVTKGKIDAILCWKMDRLARNPIDAGQVQWLLQMGKLKCIKTFERSFYPTDNVLLINIEQAMAIQYIRDLSTNVKRGNRAKLERGEWPNRAPFGYKNDKATKTIIPDTKTSRFVTRAFDLYTTGAYTLKQVSDTLYSEGLRTYTGKKVQKGHIHKILGNPLYSGILRKEDKLYTGTHQPLTTVAIFEKAQEVLQGRTHPRPKKRFYAERGFLTCGNCGCTLTADTQKGHIYYYCTNGKGSCDQHKKYLRSDTVTNLISEVLTSLAYQPKLIELSGRAYKELFVSTDHQSDLLRTNLTEQLSVLSKKESLLVDGYTSQLITEEVFKLKMLELENTRTQVRQKLSELDARGRSTAITFEQVKNVFLEGNKASKLYAQSSGEARRYQLIRLLSNIQIKDQNIVTYQFKSPFDVLAKGPKNGSLSEMLAVWDDIRTSLLINVKARTILEEGFGKPIIREAR